MQVSWVCAHELDEAKFVSNNLGKHVIVKDITGVLGEENPQCDIHMYRNLLKTRLTLERPRTPTLWARMGRIMLNIKLIRK